MRNVSGEGGAVLPWLLIRQDGHGNRYRVGSFATRAEAQQIAERLGGRPGVGDSYLVERRDAGSGVRG
ncbi:SPOR domain-containing protein [Streptomyces sp. JJ36]|uniref:SPOR domain-containing protein n=1 Tax=Streptomyces sp. JJ36 TaxID=2736645 RepID=UPI001F012C0D|nr:SPOR domain-containing protein [Streptomyces sp. JJ36]MCF6521977.1 SPOR domain-containing protein [Streptomyces sp. JJ36]